MSEEKKAPIKIHTDIPARHHFVFEDGRVYTITCPTKDTVLQKYETLKLIIEEFKNAIEEEQKMLLEKAKKEAESFKDGKKIVETTKEEFDNALENAEFVAGCSCCKQGCCDAHNPCRDV